MGVYDAQITHELSVQATIYRIRYEAWLIHVTTVSFHMNRYCPLFRIRFSVSFPIFERLLSDRPRPLLTSQKEPSHQLRYGRLFWQRRHKLGLFNNKPSGTLRFLRQILTIGAFGPLRVYFYAGPSQLQVNCKGNPLLS